MQVDRVLPQRFDLTYAAEDSAQHRPVMVHRGLLGSMERMIALLIERYDGRFPTWLAPVQVDAALDRIRDFEADRIRARLLDRGTLGARIRQSHEDRAAYTAVVGQVEADCNAVAINRREMPLHDAVDSLREEIATRSRLRRL